MCLSAQRKGMVTVMSDFKTELQIIKSVVDSGTANKETEALAAAFKRKPVVLYGAGTLSGLVMKSLEKYGVSIECFCDTYWPGIHKTTGLPIISAEQLKRDYSDAIVIITSELHGRSIMNTLRKIDYQGKIYSFEDLLGFYVIEYEEFEPHIAGYEWAYDYFSDAVSKQIVLDSIRTRLLGTPMKASMNPQYFEPEICPLSDEEVFVDGGCFIGDTAEEFIRQVKGKYKRIYGFEPDENNLKKARANLAQYQHIDLLHGGLWHMTNCYKFVSGAFGNSKFSEEGDVISKTYGIDEFFANKEDKPTWIKMDIEGAERLALDGAAKILKRDKPKLAICVYHTLQDIYDLPQRILYHNPDYKLTLRHYSNWYAESVCYGV